MCFGHGGLFTSSVQRLYNDNLAVKKRLNRGYQVHVLPLLCVQSWFWLEMIPRGEGGSQRFTQEISLFFFCLKNTRSIRKSFYYYHRCECHLASHFPNNFSVAEYMLFATSSLFNKMVNFAAEF